MEVGLAREARCRTCLLADQRVAELVSEIGGATGEQTTGLAQVSDAVARLDRVTQQNAWLVEQSAASAETLKAQAAKQVEVASVFRLAA